MQRYKLNESMLFEQKKGIVPTIKGMLFGGNRLNAQQLFVQELMESQISQNLLQWVTGSHTFNRKNFDYLTEIGYVQNPIVFGIVNAIIFGQRNIKYTPYWKGRPYKSKTFELDTNKAFFNILTTGTCVFWNREVVGFGKRLTVVDTANIEETRYSDGTYKYRLIENGRAITMPTEDLIFKRFLDNPTRCTNFGLSPIQAAIMPVEALREMYTADTSLLKNKGSELLISNGTDTPLIQVENETFDEAMNKRVAGAKKFGKIATTTAKVEVHQLGRTIKEMALWDGYKVKTRDICVALNYPSTLAGDTDASTLANYSQSQMAKYTGCIIPLAQHLFTGHDMTDTLGFEVFIDISGIECLQESFAVKAEKAKTIQDAIILLNEKVKYGIITADIAINILVNEWGYEEEEAVKMINANPIPPQQENNVTY